MKLEMCVAGVTKKEIVAALAKKFGFCSVVEQTGAYTMDNGDVVTETSYMAYMYTTNDSDWLEWEDMAFKLGTDAFQESVLVSDGKSAMLIYMDGRPIEVVG